jgi:hypothetical protein
MSRHRGAKPRRRCELSGAISLLSPAYLLSVARWPFHSENHRITKTCFRSCSSRRSHSQAPFCLCTRRAIADRAEGTFARLRYLLGGDRPSQTARLPGSKSLIQMILLELHRHEGGISLVTPCKPEPADQRLPPMLRTQRRNSTAGCSKGAWGLFVLS